MPDARRIGYGFQIVGVLKSTIPDASSARGWPSACPISSTHLFRDGIFLDAKKKCEHTESQQNYFKHVGTGGNIPHRTRPVHATNLTYGSRGFSDAGEHSLTEALRFGQVVGAGGARRSRGNGDRHPAGRLIQARRVLDGVHPLADVASDVRLGVCQADRRGAWLLQAAGDWVWHPLGELCVEAL